MGSGGLKEPCTRWGPDPPMQMINFRGKDMPGHARRHSAVSCAKTAAPIETPFGLWTLVGPRKHVLDRGPDPQGPPCEGAIFRGKVMPGHSRRHFAVSCAKMAELIEMPFGLWTRVGRRKYALHGEHWRAPPGEYD